MKVLFEQENLESMIWQFQELLKNQSNHDEYEELERHVQKILQFLHDFSNLKSALDASIIVAVTNVKGEILYANDKLCELSKFSKEELIGQNHRILKSGYHDKAFFSQMWKTIANGQVWEGEVKNKAKDGSFYWVKTTIVPIMDSNGKPVLYISFRTDITEGKLAQEKLVTALKNDFRLVVNSMYNLIFKISKDGENNFVYILSEGKLGQQIGLEREIMLNKTPKDIFPAELAAMFETKYEEAFLGVPITYTYDYRDKNLLTYLSPVSEGDEIVEVIGVCNDITELHHAQEEVKFMAFHDMLTNLPNRRQFKKDIIELLSRSKQNNEKFAVFFLDLDRFKQINDSLGHTVGDLLIQEVSNRLLKEVGNEGTIYRFAGDEFILLVPNVDFEKKVSSIARRILSGFENILTLSQSLQMYTTASIGISIFPSHGKDYDSLLKNADTAMFVAKSKGRNTFQIYEPMMNKNHEETLLIEQYLRHAFDNHEFELHFQPKLDLYTQKVNGMEALLRWRSPVLGKVPPDKFIPVAEDTGFIIKIDEWVLEEACRQNHEWNKNVLSSSLKVSVNISPIHFRQPNFVNVVKDTLDRTGLAPNLLEIEITENSFIENVEECIISLRKLKELGVSVAIDDFGKGYSSLNYLRKFPITSLKIDRSFIQEVADNTEDIAVVRAIIYLSHELNLRVVAEGTETKEVIEMLKELGCNEVQGYYVSKPLPKWKFENMIKHINEVAFSK